MLNRWWTGVGLVQLKPAGLNASRLPEYAGTYEQNEKRKKFVLNKLVSFLIRRISRQDIARAPFLCYAKYRS